jgi:DHA1 family multidrug resistance protein-like MFS transporter
LTFGSVYIWFESFPLVFQEGHGFNPGETGLAFLGILVGVVGTMVCFCIYARRSLEPKFVASEDGTIKPEIRLKPACISCVFSFS